MTGLPDGWFDKSPFAERIEAEIKAAFKWPMRICAGVGIILLALATWAVM